MYASVVCSSDSIFGSATFTTEESMNAMLDPGTHAANTHDCRRLSSGPVVAPAGVRMTASSPDRACVSFMPNAPVFARLCAVRIAVRSRSASAAGELALALRQHPLRSAIADHIRQQHIDQCAARIAATAGDVVGY